MSNTRRANPGAPLRQERWMSSEEFERGLLANCVAKRCSVLESSEDRDLIWYLQKTSHQPGGIEKLASDLIKIFPNMLGTKSMRKFGMQPGKIYSEKEMEAICREMKESGPSEELEAIKKAETARIMRAVGSDDYYGEKEAEEEDGWPVEEFFDLEKITAETLPNYLKELCLNPECSITCGPWFFPGLIGALKDYRKTALNESRKGKVVTEIGRRVCDTLDYALAEKCLVLIQGHARMGKSFSAKVWCEERPGQARYVQVPSTNDDIGFFRAIAKSLGVCVGRAWKATQLRERIEAVLQDGDLILVMDEAHYLWPLSDCRHTVPGRVSWLMTALVNYGVPVALITTPQFIRTQKAVERRTHWTSEQFIGRIGHFESLPDRLSKSDLAKVATALLPGADEPSIEILVCHAQVSAKYLAGIESVVRRARYLAHRENREAVTRKDIKRAIQESVNPSDTALAIALAEPARNKRGRPKQVCNEPLSGNFERVKTPLPERILTEAEDEIEPMRRDLVPT